MKITILGNGAFGSAVIAHLERKGHQIFIDEIKDSEIIFVCVPSYAVLEVLTKFQKEITNQKIIICSKGFAGEGKFISEVLKENFENDFFFLYGPVLADELREGKFSSMVLAGSEEKDFLKKEIESENLHIETSNDVMGVEISAALKNAITMFIGILEGAQYGENARAFIFTKGVNEIRKIGLALGAKDETFLGITCIGDLTLYSRNRRFGIEFGKGKNINDIIKEMNYTPEGISALKNAKIIIEEYNIDTPVINLLYKIIFEGFPLNKVFVEIQNYKK